MMLTLVATAGAARSLAPTAGATRSFLPLRRITTIRSGPSPSAPGNVLAALVSTAGCVGVVTAPSTPVAAASYLTFSVASYCLRRGMLHKWPNGGSAIGAAEVLRRHVEYDRDWHLRSHSTSGRLAHAGHVLLWLLLFQPVYPLLEVFLFPFDKAAFWFYCERGHRYHGTAPPAPTDHPCLVHRPPDPKARGSGLVIDSRALRRSGKRGNAAQVFRLDWHSFHLNVGQAYPPPHTGRHPPKVSCNLPHVDLPTRGVRHWPWRQHTGRLLWLLPRDGGGGMERRT
jgi:hypothetical protein